MNPGSDAVADRIQLRIPGPTPLPDAVREAGARQMINHRSPEFRELITRVTGRLQHAFGTSNDVLILTSSGTGGLEAAIVNHLSPGDRVLAVTIGSFGDRFAEIAERYGASVRRLEVEWGRAARAADVAAALNEMAAQGSPARAVLLTHNETSTGVVNPLADLSGAVHRAAPDALLIVDAISGLGAVPFETDGWGLDVVATGSQKSWMVPPGLAMISVSERAWAAAEAARMPRFYFDLAEARRFEVKGETPWTPAVGVLFALDVALEMLESEGYPQIFERHAACGRAARAGLTALGFRLLAVEGYASDTVTAAYLPDDAVWVDLNRELRSRGLVLAGGQGKLSGRILRVGHLGDVRPADIADAMAVLEEGLRALGVAVEKGAGRRAAEEAANAQANSQVPTRA
jgi:aspartate aminotransferase-like enzyme